jgi:hypothetical protein
MEKSETQTEMVGNIFHFSTKIGLATLKTSSIPLGV